MANTPEHNSDIWTCLSRIEFSYDLQGDRTLYDLKQMLEALGFGQIFVEVSDLRSGKIIAARVP